MTNCANRRTESPDLPIRWALVILFIRRASEQLLSRTLATDLWLSLSIDLVRAQIRGQIGQEGVWFPTGVPFVNRTDVLAAIQWVRVFLPSGSRSIL